MKKLYAILLTICMVLALTGCRTKQAAQVTRPAFSTQATVPTEESTEPTTQAPTQPETSQITPLLYCVTDTTGNTLWLFGSIHVGREDFYPLPTYVTYAYEQSDVLAVEADIYAFQSDLTAQMEALRPLVYTDGTTIQEHLPEELYAAAVEILKANLMYTKPMEYYCPAMWSSLISSAAVTETELEAQFGIDMHFLERAHEDGKSIKEVESAAFQYQMLADFSDELQVYMLASSIYEYENSEESTQTLALLADAWGRGDESALLEMLAQEAESIEPEEAIIYEEYYEAMYTNRNLGMAQFAEEALDSGEEVFLCVGAAHILGDGALIDLLTQRGYAVRQIQ